MRKRGRVGEGEGWEREKGGRGRRVGEGEGWEKGGRRVGEGESLDPLTPVLVPLTWYRYGTAYTACMRRDS